MEEKQLYRGGFKNNLFHGHGSLYWPGSDQLRYTGRFKNGIKNGRGIDFDTTGKKIFQGSYRDDKKEGRGEEFTDMDLYRGEFSNNARHGFGVIYFEENSKYFGRIENNEMSGLGIYFHANGNRFEGMLFKNKPDGPGSFYEYDPVTNELIKETHAMWTTSGSKNAKPLTQAFLPTAADLPDDASQVFYAVSCYYVVLQLYTVYCDFCFICACFMVEVVVVN